MEARLRRLVSGGGRVLLAGRWWLKLRFVADFGWFLYYLRLSYIVSYYPILFHIILYYFILSEVEAEGRCWKEEDGEAGRQSEKP